MNPSRVVSLVGLVVLTTACVQPRACTEIGATNGVRVTVVGFPRALVAQGGPDEITVQACLGATCGTGIFLGAEEDSAWVDLRVIDSTDPVDVTVTVRTQAGELLVPATTVRSTPTKVQPNGPGCDPTAYQAAVTVGR